MFDIRGIRCGCDYGTGLRAIIPEHFVEVEAITETGTVIYAIDMYTGMDGGIERVQVNGASRFEAYTSGDMDDGEYADIEYFNGEENGDTGEYEELIEVSRKFMRYFNSEVQK